jgi:hypothetical protein
VSIEAEIAAQFAGALEVEHAVEEFAHKVADYAKTLAPVFGDKPPKRGAPPQGSPGDYRGSIKVEHPPRAGATPTRRVISRDHKAIWIELGTRHMPEYAVFTKTAKYFGGTGPIIDEGVQHAQHHLRGELERLAKLTATGAAADRIAAQRKSVESARTARSSAFKAARRGRRRR